MNRTCLMLVCLLAGCTERTSEPPTAEIAGLPLAVPVTIEEPMPAPAPAPPAQAVQTAVERSRFQTDFEAYVHESHRLKNLIEMGAPKQECNEQIVKLRSVLAGLLPRTEAERSKLQSATPLLETLQSYLKYRDAIADRTATLAILEERKSSTRTPGFAEKYAENESALKKETVQIRGEFDAAGKKLIQLLNDSKS